MKLKLTPAQTIALHTAESVGISALITTFVGIGQYLATNGLNFATLGGTCGAIFVGSMTMVYKSLSTNAQVAAGVADTVSEARAVIQQELSGIRQALTGGQTLPAQLSSTLLQAPAQLDPVSIADTILQHLDTGSIAQRLAQELMKIRVPSPQSMPAVQPPPARPQTQPPTYAPQQQPFTAG